MVERCIRIAEVRDSNSLGSTMKPSINRPTILERVVSGIGSPFSLVVHTLIFAAFFGSAVIGLLSWDMMLLFLTTIVSLEAIYLAIFIQMTVNEHTRSLREVEEDIDEIQEDIDEIEGDIDEIQEDVEEITEDIEEITEDEAEEKRKQEQRVTLEQLTGDVRRVLADLEALKEKK